MSYNGSGTFVINSTGQPVVTGTVISSSTFNSLTADLGTGLSTAITKDGQTTTTAKIPFAQGLSAAVASNFAAGTVGAPSIYLSTDTTTGLYRIGANNDGFAVSGVKLLDLGSALVGITGALTVSTTLGVTGTSTLAAVNASGPTFTLGGDTVAAPILTLNGTAASSKQLKFNSAGVEKWNLYMAATTHVLTLASAALGPSVLEISQTTGSVGIGVAPSAWKSTTRAIELGAVGNSIFGFTSAGSVALTSNIYFSSALSDWTYASSAVGALLYMSAGAFDFYTAPSGTVGNAVSLASRFTVANNGIITMGVYGAGAATFSASGVISSVSDETWKVKDGIPTNPDAMLKKLAPGYWYYNDEKKETFGADRQLGFYAQNVNAAIGPEAAPEPETVTKKNEDGTETSVTKPWGYYDRSVLAITVMSLQKALTRLEALEAK